MVSPRSSVRASRMSVPYTSPMRRTGWRQAATPRPCTTPGGPGWRGSEEDGGQGGEFGEADFAVDGAGWRVEVVDVQRHDGRDGPQRLLDHRGHPGHGETLAPQLRAHPDSLHLACVRGDGPDLGLEHHPPVLDPGERPAER